MHLKTETSKTFSELMIAYTKKLTNNQVNCSLLFIKESGLRVSENMVLRKIFGPRGGQGNRGVEELHNEELNDLCCSPNIIGVIKSRRMGWEGHVTRMGDRSGAYWVYGGET